MSRAGKRKGVALPLLRTSWGSPAFRVLDSWLRLSTPAPANLEAPNPELKRTPSSAVSELYLGLNSGRWPRATAQVGFRVQGHKSTEAELGVSAPD